MRESKRKVGKNLFLSTHWHTHGRVTGPLTTFSIFKGEITTPDGHIIEWRELVALCAPLSTAAWEDKNTNIFPSGLQGQEGTRWECWTRCASPVLYHVPFTLSEYTLFFVFLYSKFGLLVSTDDLPLHFFFYPLLTWNTSKNIRGNPPQEYFRHLLYQLARA